MPKLKIYTEKPCLACKKILEVGAFDNHPTGALKKYCRVCQNNITRTYLVSKKRDELRMCNTCHMLTTDFCTGKTICRPCRKTQNAAAYQRKLAIEEVVTPGARVERASRRLKKIKEKTEKKDVRERGPKMCEDERTCAHCDETSHNFSGKKTVCRPCTAIYNYSYKYGNPNERTKKRNEREGIPTTQPVDGKMGRWGCFEMMPSGIAVCDCGTKFTPTNLHFRYSRPCWHLEAAAELRQLMRQSGRND